MTNEEVKGDELLDGLEPVIVRNLDPIYQRLLEIWRKAKSRQNIHDGSIVEYTMKMDLVKDFSLEEVSEMIGIYRKLIAIQNQALMESIEREEAKQ